MRFTELDLNPQILEAIDYMGFEEMTPVQEQAIPLIMQGRDLIACAQTGTGKTAAFIIPILDRIIGRDIRGINTLIIVPTRELALQIDQHIQGLAYFSPVNSLAVYGGGDGIGFDQERTALESDTAIIVATPGKLIAHLNMGYANFGNLEHLILDEADKMLDMGFFEDIRKIISFLPEKRQSLMFSATMPHNIRKLAKHIMTDHAEITLELAKPAEGVLQAAYFVFDNQKTGLITSLLKDKQGYDRILIFTSTKSKVNDIVRALKREGFNVKGISSDLQQKDREEVLLQFKAKNVNVLVATDVLSRGIDIKDIDLVINYD
ncbi:MAG: DEAD/DEAH box helicase, partial [Bacteroidota bacterium]